MYSFDNIKSENMQYQKRLTESRYCSYNKGFENEFIFVEAKFSKYVHLHMDYFNEYERNQILRRQIRILLNTVPQDLVYWLEKKPRNDIMAAYDWF